MDPARYDYFLRRRREVEAASHGEKGELIAGAARHWGKSEKWVREQLRAVGWNPQRKTRSDRGRSVMSREEVLFIAGLVKESTRANGKRLMSTQLAIDIAYANGRLRTKISRQTADKEMRRHRVHPTQLARPTPHTNLRAPHPNHTWEFDVSVCVLFYMDGGGLGIRDEKRFYKNKPQNDRKIEKFRVLRYVMTDRCSGAFYVKYYRASGETEELTYDFLMEAFTKRAHPQDPFHGVPFNLVWDKGSANQSHTVRNLLDRLQVRHLTHKAGNPRGKGQVEGAHRFVEGGFESTLRLKSYADIDVLNHEAHVWMRDRNANWPLERAGVKVGLRYGLWQTIKPHELRICPDRALCDQLLDTHPESRRVNGDLSIKFAIRGYGPNVYDVSQIPDICVGDTVNVCVNPYRAPNVNVIVTDQDGKEAIFDCPPVDWDQYRQRLDAAVIGEQYKSTRDTTTDHARKEIERLAYGAETQDEAQKARDRREPPFKGEIDATSYLEARTLLRFMERPGTELHLPHQVHVQPTLIGAAAIASKVRALFGRNLTPGEYLRIRERFPEKVPEAEIDAKLQQIRAWYPEGIPEIAQEGVVALLLGNGSEPGAPMMAIE